MGWQQAFTFSLAVGLAAGCAHHMESLRGSSGWSTGILFWPPPRPTSSLLGVPWGETTLGKPAAFVAGALHDAGYADARWLPIGAGFEHGFAVTTRLESIDPKGAADAQSGRWLTQYPEAATLRWLAGSSTPYLPRAGRYRAVLVAFTDLQERSVGQRPEQWDETTAMDGPGLRPGELPVRQRVRPGYRIGVYVYEYESDGTGAHIVGDGTLSRSPIQGSALAPLITRAGPDR